MKCSFVRNLYGLIPTFDPYVSLGFLDRIVSDLAEMEETRPPEDLIADELVPAKGSLNLVGLDKLKLEVVQNAAAGQEQQGLVSAMCSGKQELEKTETYEGDGI